MFVLSYDINEIDVAQVHEVFQIVKDALPEESHLLAIPNFFSLTKCQKEDLVLMKETLERLIEQAE